MTKLHGDPIVSLRQGSVQGAKHLKMRVNNQDAGMCAVFSLGAGKRTYRIGLVSDGCTGIPAFTRSEVGSNLLVVLCLARIQEFLATGMKPEDIPVPLYHAVTNFIRDLSNTIMPSTICWPFDVTFTGGNAFRNTIKANERFVVDYMAATIIGFIDDGVTLVTFQAGDGVVIVNDTAFIADQNDRPDYPAISRSSSGSGFITKVYASADVRRIAIATDGIEELLGMPELDLLDRLFVGDYGDLSLQFLLNRLMKAYPGKMGDDCTVIIMEKLPESAT